VSDADGGDRGFGADAARDAAGVVRARLGVRDPAAGIILGSGLGGLAARIAGARRIAFDDIPGFPAASVAGHEGALIAGTLAGREVVALAGRFHAYEGHSARLAAFPVRVLHALGVRILLVSNASGGIRRTFRPGELMIIADHINLAGRNPLTGALEPSDVRFPDMSEPYDGALRALLRDSARDAGVPVSEGVYAWLLGPTYETPSEVRMLERFGADAVGMSTVPEVLVARALGMRVAGMSCVANLAAGLTPEPITHEEVLASIAQAAARFETVAERFIAGLAQ
jgi:purine-nucleoside phosphorylase